MDSELGAFDFLKRLHKVCQFQTREKRKVGLASNSELRRWIQNKAFVVNGIRVGVDENIAFPITSCVLFPKNPITLC